VTTETELFALFEEGNPVPDLDGLGSVALDAAAYLATLEQRSSDMTQLDTKAKDNKEKKKNGMAFLVAAAVVIVAGIGFMVVNQGDETLADAPELSVVIANLEAWNSGDYDGYLATFTVEAAQGDWGPDGNYGRGEPAHNLPQVLMNANSRIELVEPCRVIETSQTGESTVQCLTIERNDWSGPAGITTSATQTFVVNAENKISRVDTYYGAGLRDVSAYSAGFWLWLQVAHPGVYEEIKPINHGNLPGWPRDEADMLIAVQYVDGFVAQTDDYPINP